MKKVGLSLFGLVMLMSGAVDGVSNLPSIALFGPSLIVFFIVASIVFLLPTGLVSAELCAQFPEQGGVFAWGKKAFGEGFGVMAVWLQWINTMIWFPTCLTTLVGTAAYLIDPPLSHNPVYLVTTSVSIFWLMTLINLKGIKFSTLLASFASTVGMLIPMVLIIMLSVAWLVLGRPVQMHLTAQTMMPHLFSAQGWGALTAIITSFLGMELATVHVTKVKNAHKTFPKALLLTIVVIILTMGFGSLGVALTVPHKDIVLVSGTIQAFNALFSGFGMPWMKDALGCMLVFGSLGAMVNWLVSPSVGLSQVSKLGYLPKVLAKENQYGVPSNILIVQAIVVTVVASAFFMLPSVNGSYWYLLDLSTQLYVLMYVLMFVAAIKLTFQCKTFHVMPFGRSGMLLTIMLGLTGCAVALVVGFIPPAGVQVGSVTHFITLFSAGLLAMALPGVLIAVRLCDRKCKYGFNTADAIKSGNSLVA